MTDATLERGYAANKTRREWWVSGDGGSISFWVEEFPRSHCSTREPYYGGVETHYRKHTAPEYLGKAPSQQDCHANKGPCWHDGSSLWASEYWIPYILPGGPYAIYARLEAAYRERFPLAPCTEEMK